MRFKTYLELEGETHNTFAVKHHISRESVLRAMRGHAFQVNHVWKKIPLHVRKLLTSPIDLITNDEDALCTASHEVSLRDLLHAMPDCDPCWLERAAGVLKAFGNVRVQIRVESLALPPAEKPVHPCQPLPDDHAHSPKQISAQKSHRVFGQLRFVPDDVSSEPTTAPPQKPSPAATKQIPKKNAGGKSR